MSSSPSLQRQLAASRLLVETAQRLSLCRELDGVMQIVRDAARMLTGADGATFILREGDLCFYADENAIGPLWKGRRFPMVNCISGWAMLNKQPVKIPDIYVDDSVPHDAYRLTFVKSLVVVPIRPAAPIGAIGNYWASDHEATDEEVELLQALANLTSVALENVHLYDELQKQVAEAQRAVQARDEFLAVAAHELRTPLTALQLSLQSLQELANKEANRGDDRLVVRASRAVSSTRRIGSLVEGLLDVARVSIGQLELKRELFDLGQSVKDVAERFAQMAALDGCELRVQTGREVPGEWDRVRMEQVITNLLSNALKYGAGKPVELSAETENSRAILRVKDHGIGIPSEHVERIFQRFERAVSLRNYGGFGLGLYICRQVVEAHGGTIKVQSEHGSGSTFTVELPLAA